MSPSIVPGKRLTGTVFDIQRMSVHDGPGIRTSVFLKGCPLRCPWCHNPEGIAPFPQLFYIPALCIGCGACVKRCPQHVHSFVNQEHTLDRAKCVLCFSCADGCPAGALKQVGSEMSVEAVLAEVTKDVPFYEESGGGMTLTGGEPLLQSSFALALLAAAKDLRIHTCVETSGFVPAEHLDRAARVTDLFLFDIKETDPDRHLQLTGVPFEPIQRNLLHLSSRRAPIVLRCVIIPEINLREDHLYAIANLAKQIRICQGIELMPYHSWGENKRIRLGEPPRVFSEVTDEQRAAVLEFLNMCELHNVCWV